MSYLVSRDHQSHFDPFYDLMAKTGKKTKLSGIGLVKLLLNNLNLVEEILARLEIRKKHRENAGHF